MPLALISTSTSPALGPPNSTSSMVSGWPAFHAIAALVFIFILAQILDRGEPPNRATTCVLVRVIGGQYVLNGPDFTQTYGIHGPGISTASVSLCVVERNTDFRSDISKTPTLSSRLAAVKLARLLVTGCTACLPS